MSVPTAELTAPAAAPPKSEDATPRRRFGAGRIYLALVGAALLIGALSLLIPSTPSYDPWAWLVWGREIAHLKLHTTGGPTWKPLPVVFTTIFSLFGKAAPDLWLVIARAGALMALAMTFKVAARITREVTSLSRGRGQEAGAAWLAASRWAGPALLAGLIAAASLVNGRGFISDNALGYSEGLMTALVLIAIDRHMDGARRQAFAVGFFAALDRPELWLFWGPYGLYLWWTDRGARKLVVILFALIPVMWFLPEYWGSGHFLRGVNRAQHPRSNSPAFAKCPFCTEFADHAWPKVLIRIKIVALAAMVLAAFGLWRTRVRWRAGVRQPADRARAAVLLTCAGGFVWWLLIGVLTQAGFSGNDRYLILGAALISIPGGVAWGWVANLIATHVPGIRRRALAGSIVGSGICAALLVFVPNWIGPSVINVSATHRALVYQAHLRSDMTRAVRDVGGPKRVLACGNVMTEGFQVPMLAWNLGVHTVAVQASPLPNAALPPPPNVIFQTRAQRKASLLPRVRAWKGTRYRFVKRVRTFRVYSNCAGKVQL